MSLKDEIEKLIQDEQRKIRDRDRETKKYYSKLRECFAPLRKLLEQLVVSIEKPYIKSRIDDQKATLEVGREENGRFLADVRWEIEPHYSTDTADHEESLSQPVVFSIGETHYFRMEDEVLENAERFDTDHAVVEYLMRCIAEKIAHYRHLQSLVRPTE